MFTMVENNFRITEINPLYFNTNQDAAFHDRKFVLLFLFRQSKIQIKAVAHLTMQQFYI